MDFEFFAVNEVLAQMEVDLPFAKDKARLKLLLGLAWHLRQRDSVRVRTLLAQAQSMLDADTLHDCTPAELACFRLRLVLIQAEEKWLIGELESGQILARSALQGFQAQHNALACADAHWLLSWICADLGDSHGIHSELEAMALAAKDCDPVRFYVAKAVLARDALFGQDSVAKEFWRDYFDSTRQQSAQAQARHPAAQCWVEEFWGTLAVFKREYVQAIRHFSQTYTLALASGQTRRAMIAASNIGAAFNSLDEYHAALEWMRRGLSLARHSTWPGMIGLALTQTGESLRGLQRFDEAQAMLREALEVMPEMATSRNQILALYYLGDVELDSRQYAGALASFQLLEQRAIDLKQEDLYYAALRGQAVALFQLGHAQDALQAAHTVLDGEKSVVDDKIAALIVIADIHASHQLPAPAHIQAASAPLFFLQQALALADAIPGYIVAGDVLDTVADEYADVGDYRHAYQSAKQASRARKKLYLREAANRAQALGVSHQTQSAELSSAYQRELAAEARRVEHLQHTSITLKNLSWIGQEMTAHLQADVVFEVLKAHIHDLLELDCLALYLLSDDGRTLDLTFSAPDAATALPGTLELSTQESELVRCVQERREIVVDDDAPRQAGQGAMHSRLFVPLCVAERVLGVMTIQSARFHVYGAREQMIFRTLCTYTAIALSNAHAHGLLAAAHRQLQDTQQQLVLQGKMAGLGTLTAGVAHEINNPTNFAHVAAQNQMVDLTEFQQFLSALIEADTHPDIVQAFNQRFERLFANLHTMLNGTERIKGIVRDLRSFTRLGEVEKERIHLSECLHSTLNLVRTKWLEQVEFGSEIVDDPEIECWPALLNQVFMNLLVNACQAIAEKQALCQARGQIPVRGKLCLRLEKQNDTLLISVQDNGIGIDKKNQDRILEPFYTTKAVGSGTGLGLSIAFGIVQKHGGDLSFTSHPGEGSCFTVSLPLRA